MYLGIDLGTSGVKIILIDENQQILSSADAALAAQHPHSGWSEQDPEQWWIQTKAALSQLRQQAPKAFAEVKAIGLSGQMHGAVLLDASGQVLRPAILWNDGRSMAECAEMERDCPELTSITGNRAMPGFTAPKLAWLHKHEPEIMAKLAMVLLPKDYLRYRLTGEYITDCSDASGTLLFNVAQRSWSTELIELLQLKPSQLPQVIEGNAASGEVSSKICAELEDNWNSRAEPAPIVAGSAADNAAVAAGIGATTPQTGFISLGTSGVVLLPSESYQANTAQAVHSFAHCLPNMWYQMGVILSATDSLNWLADRLGSDAASLVDGLGQALQQPSEVLFAPYLSGERTPHNDTAVRGGFFGLSLEHDNTDLLKAVMTGVCFALKDNFNALGIKQNTASETAFYLVGGGAKSNYWAQLMATVLKQPLRVTSAGNQAASLGAARLAMAAYQNSADTSLFSTPTDYVEIEPVASLNDSYLEQYQHYKTLYQKLS